MVSHEIAQSQAAETTPLLSGRDGLAKGNGASGSGSSAEHAEHAATAEVTPARLFMILGTAYVGVFLGAADASVIATLSAGIASEFQSLSLLPWLASAYLVANAACQPVSGRVTDVVGRGPGLVFSNVAFAVGNLLCALSGSSATMLAGRVVAGIGGGGLMSISTFLASDLVPLRRRGIIQGIGNIAYGSGAMLGGVLGGLTENLAPNWRYGGWRIAFFAQVPVSLLSAVLVMILVRLPPHQADDDDDDEGGHGSSGSGSGPVPTSALARLARIDFTGAALLVAFLVLLLLGFSAGGNIVPWTHPLVLLSLPLSAVAFVGFVLWEDRRAVHPIIPVRLVASRTILAACVVNLVCTAAVMMAAFYVPLYLQVRGYTAADAGLRLLFSPLGVSVTSVGSGIIMRRTGRYLRLGIAALVVFCAAHVLALAGLSSATSPAWVPFATFFLSGGGYGSMLTVTLLACIASVDQVHQAVVTSATYAFRSVGGTVGLTVAAAVYQNLLRSGLASRFGHLPGAAAEIARICDDLDELQHLPAGWHDGVIQSYMDAFRGVWLVGLVLSVIGLVCICLMKQHTLHSTLSRS